MYVIQQLGRVFGTKSYFLKTSFGYKWVKDSVQANHMTRAEANKLFNHYDFKEQDNMWSKYSIVKVNV